MTQNATLTGEKIYEMDLALTGVADFGVSMDAPRRLSRGANRWSHGARPAPDHRDRGRPSDCIVWRWPGAAKRRADARHLRKRSPLHCRQGIFLGERRIWSVGTAS